jgi:hypothetical protein
MTRLFSVLGIGAIATLTGCASIVSDSDYPVAIKSAPEGAVFEITKLDGEVVHSGTTPQTVTLKSGNGYFGSATYVVKFEKDGFAEQSVTIDSSMDGWFWGNIIFGGLIGMLIVDPITGAMWKLPENSEVTLVELAPPTEPVVENGEAASQPAAPVEVTEEAAPVEGADTGKSAESAPKPEDTLSVITIDQVPAALRPHLVRIN